MHNFEQPAYSDPVRIPKAGDTVYIKFKNQPYRKERLVNKLSSGGEGAIFSTESYASTVIKLYHPEKLTQGRVKKITALAEEIEDINGEIFDYICWPKATVFDYEQGHMIGYLMERVPSDTQPLADIIAQMADGSNPVGYDRRDLAELCLRIAQRFSLLHRLARRRLLMCDVNPGNIMISPKDKQVYFVDLDSYQYETNNGTLLRCPVGREEYTSPELYERLRDINSRSYADVDRTETDEGFAVAVLYFDILLLGQAPFARFGESCEAAIRQGNFVYRDGQRTSRIWDNLTPKLREMFQGIFMNRRVYNDSDWIGAFAALLSDIEQKKLSAQLLPTASPMSETDRILPLRCKRCGKAFIGSQQLYDTCYPFCNSCMTAAFAEERISKRVTCSKCGQQFVVNSAYQASDPNWQPICPDCDPKRYYMNSSMFADPRIASAELVPLAMKNWEES